MALLQKRGIRPNSQQRGLALPEVDEVPDVCERVQLPRAERQEILKLNTPNQLIPNCKVI